MSENCDYVGDWPSCLHFMKDLDEVCRCPICYDFMQAPMLLPNCDHNFCSLCIRQFFVHKEHCPVCLKSASSNELRNNRVLEIAILQMRKIRKTSVMIAYSRHSTLKVTFLLDLANKNKMLDRTSLETSPSRETTIFAENGNIVLSTLLHTSQKGASEVSDVETPAPGNFTNVEDKVLMAGEEHNLCLVTSAAVCDGDSDVEIITDNSKILPSFKDKAFTGASPRPKTVQSKLFSHLKMSTDRGKITTFTAERSSSIPKDLEGKSSLKDDARSLMQSSSCFFKDSAVGDGDSSLNNQPANKVPCPVCGIPVLSRTINNHLDICLSGADKKQSLRFPEKRKHMPKLVYSLMSDKEIRRRLRELDLSAEGDRKVLTKRHHDFTLLYNANCDALVSKDISVLKKEFEEQRQVQKKLALKDLSAGQMTLHFPKNSTQLEIEKAQKLYARRHKKQFKSLIEQTKSAMAAARTKKDRNHLPVSLAQKDGVDETSSQLEERNLSHLKGDDGKKCTKPSGESSKVASDVSEACWEKVLEHSVESCGFAQASALEPQGVDIEEHLSEESTSSAHESALPQTLIRSPDDDHKNGTERDHHTSVCCRPVRQFRKCSDAATIPARQSMHGGMTGGVSWQESAALSEAVRNEDLDQSSYKNLKDRSFENGDGGNISDSLSHAASLDVCRQFCLDDDDAAEQPSSDFLSKYKEGNSSPQFDARTGLKEVKTAYNNSDLKPKLQESCSGIPVFKKSVSFSVSQDEKCDESLVGTDSLTDVSESQVKSSSRTCKVFSLGATSSSQEECSYLPHKARTQTLSSVLESISGEDAATSHEPVASNISRNLRKKRKRSKDSASKICDDVEYSASALPLGDENSTAKKKSVEEKVLGPEGACGLQHVSKTTKVRGMPRKCARRRKSLEGGVGEVFYDVTSSGDSFLANCLPEHCLHDTREKDSQLQNPLRPVHRVLRARKCSDAQNGIL